MLQVENDSEVKVKFDAIGGSIMQMGEKSEKAAESAGKVQVNFKDAATSLVDVADKAFALYTQFGNLEKMQLRVEKSQKSQEQATLQLNKAQHALGELVNGGVKSGKQYEFALARIALAKEKERLASEDATQAQQDLTESQIQFALSVVPQVIGMASSAAGAMAALGFSFAGAGAGAAGGAGGVRAFDFSLKTLMASHPYLLAAMIASAAVFTLVATNAFGFRDALDSVGRAVGEALPFLRPLLDALGGISNFLEGMQGPSAQASDSVGQMAAQSEEYLKKAEEEWLKYQTTIDGAAASTTSLGSAAAAAGEDMESSARRVQTFRDYMDELAASTEEARRENIYFIRSTGELAGSVSLSNQQLDLAAGYLRDQQAETRQVIRDNFDLLASHTSLQHALSLTNDQLSRQAEKYRDVEDAKSKDRKEDEDEGDNWWERSAKAAREKYGDVPLVRKNGKWRPMRQTEQGTFTTAAHGFSGMVTGPTLFLTGEAGPETVNIAPAGSGSAAGSRPIMITVVTTLDGREVARTVSRHQAENI